MEYINKNLPLLAFIFTSTFALSNLVLAIMKELRDRRKEQAEQLQQETTEKENGAYPPRKDKHRKQ